MLSNTSKESHAKVPEPSALTELINSAAGASSSSSPNSLSAVTLQVLHNLQHQHLWTSLQTHAINDTTGTLSTLSHQPTATTSTQSETSQSSPLPSLISGIPPHRIYTHPDEQLFMLERGLRDDDLPSERVYVLPTAQGQSWSLCKLAAVFDSLPRPLDDQVSFLTEDTDTMGRRVGEEKAAKLAEYFERRVKACRTREWGGKRLLLAMINRGIGGEGTVVYYVVQEGAVKPRQN